MLMFNKGRKMTTKTQVSTPSNAWGNTRDSSASRALASLLLAAGVSALVVLADQLMARWADTHEVAAWLVLWGIAVMAIVLLRGLTRLLARQAMRALDTWSAGVARRRADERLWNMARHDPRMMAELQCALARSEQGPAKDLLELNQRRAARIVRDRLHYI